MGKKPETWPVRSCSNHFSEAEKALIAKAFREGIRPAVIAEQLGCTIRIIQGHFARMAGHQSDYYRSRRKALPRPRHTAADPSSRHYHSDFEPR